MKKKALKATNKNSSNSHPIFAKNLQGKIIFIRHGETDYNMDFSKKGAKIKYDIKYLDGHLNSNGCKQAEKSSELFKNLEIEAVYVSPLYRTLESASIIFKNHPKKSSIKLIVHPFLTEVVSSMNNFADDIEIKKTIYNEKSEIKVDWSLFDEEFKTKEEQNFYYLNYVNLLPKEKFDSMKANMHNSIKTGKMKESISELGKFISDLKMIRIESLNHLFSRAVKFKEYLKEKYKNSINDCTKKIVIVSHSCFGQMFTSKECYGKANIKEYPKDSCDMINCQAISVFI